VSWPQGEHVALLADARNAVDLAARLRQQLLHGETEHMQHGDMADRARALANHLDAALRIADVNAYPSAFAVLRVALEHQLLDDLIFRGRRLVQLVGGITAVQWAEWERERQRRADWTRDIVDWSISKKGTVRIVREGMFSVPDEQGHRWSISVYYFLIQQYDALGPRPSKADAPTTGFPLPPEQAVKYAKDNQAIYETYLKWASIRENLISNGFESAADMARIDVHYRFLSSYVHPISDRQAATYGHNRPWPQYDHYASELILLYVITFAVREIRSFMTMCGMESEVRLGDNTRLRSECDRLWASASHLWFPGQPKQPYDQFESANRLAYEKDQEAPRGDLDPAAIYYSDPLRRIVAVHQSTRELTTGTVYQSPWSRDDAQWR
jgi:hypothetical protein